MTTGFSIDSVATLDFDFTGIPRENGKGNDLRAAGQELRRD